MSTSQEEIWSETSPLLADFYQFTMLQAYFDRRIFAPAVFELFVRKLPPVRNFLLAAGLEQAVAYLRGLRIGPHEIDALRATECAGASHEGLTVTQEPEDRRFLRHLPPARARRDAGVLTPRDNVKHLMLREDGRGRGGRAIQRVPDCLDRRGVSGSACATAAPRRQVGDRPH